ncbi:unnamed protein product [Vitrella brassicaformis CCMP3155]|uniref:TLDc domain-containing protein n=2 Tax=Vitrella brassicaformis TaxID=1169539 RepID=A0A0G4FCC9_VITBC|nr:unnamed protein product [Vitrella brassicaformis CCMP3155]|eukprot:CEM10817.1 unnamed protein product [Vitrella brassicaformis CCMP3155]
MVRKRQIWREVDRKEGTCSGESPVDGIIDAADGGASDNEAAAAVFKAIRMQGWSAIPMPRELHVGVYASINPIWCLKPPLPSPLTGIILPRHTELVIDCSQTRQRSFWTAMTVQTAYELGQQMVNLKCLIHRYPHGAQGVPAGHNPFAPGWCLGIVIALVEGHVLGRRLARDKESLTEGSLKSLTFEAVMLPNIGFQQINQLASTNSDPPAAAPSQSISLPALTEVSGVTHGHLKTDERGWTTPALERVVCAPGTVVPGIADIRPLIATSRSLADLQVAQQTPPQLVELFGSIPVGQHQALANLRTIGHIRLYGIESADLTDGLRDLQRCLVDRACSKSLDLLCVMVHRSDCHSLLLNDFSTFKALASLIDTTCSPSGKVISLIHPPADGIHDVPLTHLLSYTRWDFGKLPACGLPLLSALLDTYNLQLDVLDNNLLCFEVQGMRPIRYRYVWTVTQDQVARPRNGRIAESLVGELRFSWWVPPGGCSIAIECADGWSPSADTDPPEPLELEAFSPIGLEPVRGLIVKGRIGLGVARVLLRKVRPNLEKLQLADMTTTDVLDILAWRVPKELALDSLQTEEAGQPPVVPFDERFRTIRTLTAKGDVALQFAAALRQHIPSLDMLAVAGSETEARQVLVNGGRAPITRLSLGFVSEGRCESIKADDEREGITLGDHKDQLPRISSLVMHLDVPRGDVTDPGTFILSSIWSVLEIESISQLTVVLLQRHHLDALQAAMQRRFPDGDAMEGQIRFVQGQIHVVLMDNHVAALRKAAFAHSSTADLLEEAMMRTEDPQHRLAMITDLAATVDRLSLYLPSLPLDVSATALAADWAGRVRAAMPMSVADPPSAPRRLKAPIVAAIQRRGMAMEPMMRLQGGSPCIPSPSVIASASQLMAILHKTGEQITGIEPLYKATADGHAFTDMLGRVGDATCLLLLARANGHAHGCYFAAGLQAPPQDSHLPAAHRVATHSFANALVFKASGASPPTFQSPSPTLQFITVLRAENGHHGQLPKVTVGRSIGHEWLGLWAPPPVGWVQGGVDGRCCVREAWEVPVRLHPSLPPVGYAVHVSVVDEIEVFRLVG